MKQVINQGTTAFMEVQNENVQRLDFSFVPEGLVSMEDIISQFSNVRLKLSFKKHGKTVLTLFNGTFQDFLLYLTTKPPYKYDLTNVVRDGRISFDFETIYNLKDGLSLFVEIQNSLVDVEFISTNIVVETTQGIGVTQHYKIIDFILLDTTKKEFDYNIGYNVKNLSLLDATGNFDVDSVQIQSDKFNAELSGVSLMQNLTLDFLRWNPTGNDTVVNKANEKMPVPIIPLSNHLLGNLSVKIRTNSAQAGRVLIIERNHVDKAVINNYIATTEKHNFENLKHLKQMPVSDCGCK